MEKNKRYVVQIQFQVYAKDDESVVANSERILQNINKTSRESKIILANSERILLEIENERILSIDENSWGSFDLREVDVSKIQRETLAEQLNNI